MPLQKVPSKNFNFFKLPASKIQVGRRIKLHGRDVLREHEPLFGAVHFAENHALNFVRGKIALAEQLAQSVQLLLAAQDHGRERCPGFLKALSRKNKPPFVAGIRAHPNQKFTQVADEVVKERLLW